MISFSCSKIVVPSIEWTLNTGSILCKYSTLKWSVGCYIDSFHNWSPSLFANREIWENLNEIFVSALTDLGIDIPRRFNKWSSSIIYFLVNGLFRNNDYQPSSKLGDECQFYFILNGRLWFIMIPLVCLILLLTLSNARTSDMHVCFVLCWTTIRV